MALVEDAIWPASTGHRHRKGEKKQHVHNEKVCDVDRHFQEDLDDNSQATEECKAPKQLEVHAEDAEAVANLSRVKGPLEWRGHFGGKQPLVQKAHERGFRVRRSMGCAKADHEAYGRQPVYDIPKVGKIREDLTIEDNLQDLAAEHTDVCAQRHTSALQLAY